MWVLAQSRPAVPWQGCQGDSLKAHLNWPKTWNWRETGCLLYPPCAVCNWYSPHFPWKAWESWECSHPPFPLPACCWPLWAHQDPREHFLITAPGIKPSTPSKGRECGTAGTSSSGYFGEEMPWLHSDCSMGMGCVPPAPPGLGLCTATSAGQQRWNKAGIKLE